MTALVAEEKPKEEVVYTRDYKRKVKQAIEKARKLWNKGNTIEKIAHTTHLKVEFLRDIFPKQ